LQDGGYQTKIIVAKDLSENVSANLQVSDYLDVKPAKSTKS
jgi:hypothetical protein